MRRTISPQQELSTHMQVIRASLFKSWEYVRHSSVNLNTRISLFVSLIVLFGKKWEGDENAVVLKLNVVTSKINRGKGGLQMTIICFVQLNYGFILNSSYDLSCRFGKWKSESFFRKNSKFFKRLVLKLIVIANSQWLTFSIVLSMHKSHFLFVA